MNLIINSNTSSIPETILEPKGFSFSSGGTTVNFSPDSEIKINSETPVDVAVTNNVLLDATSIVNLAVGTSVDLTAGAQVSLTGATIADLVTALSDLIADVASCKASLTTIAALLNQAALTGLPVVGAGEGTPAVRVEDITAP